MSTISIVSPIGPVFIEAQGAHLVSIRMGGEAMEKPDGDAVEHSLLAEAARQITAWFDRRLTLFDLPLRPAKTPRGAELRAGIIAIPYGDTASYGEVARRLGSGPRAVGQACRRNPFPIVVPCHRVIGANQSIGFYSGGDGLVTKRWLLDHERAN